MVRVFLSNEDKEYCWALANQAANVAKVFGRSKSSFNDKIDPKRHYVGYLTEFAFAKVFNLKHNVEIFTSNKQLDDKKVQRPDIEPNIEVRSITERRHRLIVRPWDNPDYNFVLVYYDIENSTAHPLGFIRGIDAKQDKFLKELRPNKPVYVIDQSELKPIYELWPLNRYGV